MMHYSPIVGDYRREAKGRPAPAAGSKRLRSLSRVSAFKQLTLLMVLCAVSACGFKPVYGKAERAELSNQLESIQIETEGGRLPQLLKAEIEDQMNPDARRAEKLFIMKIKFTETEMAMFINPDGTSSRGNLQYRSSYTLTRKLDGKLVDSGSLVRTSSYNISDVADYGTYVSRDDARRRGILQLAQDYKLRLANLLPKINDPHAKPVTKTLEQAIPVFRPQQNIYEDYSAGF